MHHRHLHVADFRRFHHVRVEAQHPDACQGRHVVSARGLKDGRQTCGVAPAGARWKDGRVYSAGGRGGLDWQSATRAANLIYHRIRNISVIKGKSVFLRPGDESLVEGGKSLLNAAYRLSAPIQINRRCSSPNSCRDEERWSCREIRDARGAKSHVGSLKVCRRCVEAL